MCGFAGFLERTGLSDNADAIARAMANAIRHRGPDDQGLWLDPQAGLALSHCRLSIVDLSPAGHQPMVSAAGRYVIAFNGEIYNHSEIRREFEKDFGSHAWRGHSDTEVLIDAIAAWGIEKTLARCAGMFAFALWDRHERSLTLARDRLGEKPLYFGRCGSTLLFGSDLAALRQHPSWTGDIDRQALGAMMQFNNVPAPLSIFRGIKKVRPGTYRVFRAGDDEQAGHEHVYWDASGIAVSGLAHPFEGSAEEALHEVEALIRQSLQGQMIADVPLGAFLSGGVDSSAIVALMQDMSPAPVKTFSIGFREASHNEADHARAVARHLGTDHHELIVSEREALAVIPKLASIYSEPFADSSQIPTYLVSQLARRHVTVSLSGDAGDELFSGYRRYDLAHRIWPRLLRIPRPLRKGAASLMTGVRPERWDGAVALAARLLGRSGSVKQAGDKIHKAARILALDHPDAVYRALVSHWPHPELIVPGAGSDGSIMSPALAKASPVRRMMFADMTGYLPDDILVKVDRASMAVSLESRIPLLDHRLVEFSWRLPIDILRHAGQSKWPLRQILYRHVPRDMIERPKSGFAVPLATWLRGELRPWAEDLLSESALTRHGDFDPQPIRALWKSFMAGTGNTHDQLWTVLMFQAWRQDSTALSPALVRS